MNKQQTIFIMLMVILGCKTNHDAVRKDLMNEIKMYIEFCENRAQQVSTFEETGIYFVKGSTDGDKNTVEIFQNPFYNKKYMDGHIKINDNTVVFYNINDALVNIEQLNQTELNNLPDETSKEADIGYNPVVWRYAVTDNGLERIKE